MATKTVRVCDFDEGTCASPVQEYRVWRDGDRQAWMLDLCDEHARPLLAIVEKAVKTDLPTKSRVRMEPTQLRTTDKTRHLKK